MQQNKFSKYSNYNNPEVYWIDELPAHWKLLHLKNCVSTKITDGPHVTPTFYEEGIPFVSAEAVQNGKLNFNGKRGLISPEDFKFYSKKCLPRKNDIFIVKSGSTTGKIGYVDTDETFSIWSPLALVRVNKKVHSRFLFYFLSSSFFQKQVQVSWSFGTQPNIGMGVLEALQAIVPPPTEQNEIASYLDTKTSQIDDEIELLALKARKYEKLKQSLINETVTRGLDKTVSMKGSGIEWIGDVPHHWTVKRIADIAKQNKTKNYGMIESNLLSLSYGKIIRKDLNTSFGLLPDSFETYQIVKQNSIILRLTDLQNDQKSLRVGHANEKGIITSAYIGLNFNKGINSKYAYYLLHVFDLCKVFYWFGGGLRSTMRYEDLKVIPFLIPPLNEQKAISNYLDDKTAKIDQIVITINQQIENLKELRKTLINDVVTGKIKVTQDDNNKGLAA